MEMVLCSGSSILEAKYRYTYRCAFKKIAVNGSGTLMVFSVSGGPAEAAGVLPSLAASRLLRSRWISRSSSALVFSVSRLGIRLGTAPFGSGVRRLGPGAQHAIAQRG